MNQCVTSVHTGCPVHPSVAIDGSADKPGDVPVGAPIGPATYARMFPELPSFEPDATPPQRAKKIDGQLVRALIELPVAITGESEVEAYHSLAVRDLQRGYGVGLPSGEAVARHIGVEPLTADEVGIACTGKPSETPLWYYILREADIRTGGNRLGPVGGVIVTEVLIGLLDADLTSFLQHDQEWQPRRTLSELLSAAT